MSQAAIIINVSDIPHSHSNGLTGIYTVPANLPGEEFGMLVIYTGYEIQDIGDKRTTQHWPKALMIARDVMGMNSDAADHARGSVHGKEKWGLLLCAAQPDEPRELIEAIEEETTFLNQNPPDVKMKLDIANKMNVAVNIEPDSVKAKKQELSDRVQSLRHKFEADCRKLVQKSELDRAKRNMLVEDQRLVAEGDKIWAGPEAGRGNINEIHQRSCVRLGQERPWCYVPQQLIDCPGCGAKIKENVLSCSHCAGWLDEGIETLRAMPAKQRAQKMYPERYAEPMTEKGQRARA